MKKILPLLIAIPLFAGGKAWMKIGYGTSDKWYNEDGKDTTLFLNGKASILTLDLGGIYSFYKLPAFDMFGGLNLRVVNASFNYSYTILGTTYEENLSSGFSPQNISFFIGMKAAFLKSIVGFMADLGPEFDLANDKIGNSDRQNAIFVKICGNLPNPVIDLKGGIMYFLTLEKESPLPTIWNPFGDTTKIKYDCGDHFGLILKAGYKFPFGTIGLSFLYKIRTAIKINGTEEKDSDGNHISIYPYVRISLPAFPLSLGLDFAVTEEYLPYGFSIAGKNDYVTRFGFTLKGIFKF